MILIKNGRVVDAKSNTDEILDVVIDGGKIKTIGKVAGDRRRRLCRSTGPH